MYKANSVKPCQVYCASVSTKSNAPSQHSKELALDMVDATNLGHVRRGWVYSYSGNQER